jgi:hypothetical protein
MRLNSLLPLTLVVLMGAVAPCMADPGDLLAAEQFPHSKGVLVTYKDLLGNNSFRRQLVRRDFHHNGIRLEFLRERANGRHDPEGYQVGGNIGVRLDYIRTGQGDLELDPAVQLLTSTPKVGETFTTTPAGSKDSWTCKTSAVEELTLADGHKVRCIVVDLKVQSAGEVRTDGRIWYGRDMGIVKRTGLFFGARVEEIATGRPQFPQH